MTDDLYDTLGIDRDADDAAIKAAYRSRSKATHPDRGGDADDFQEVNTAYLVLIDPARRRRYDATGTVDDAVDNEHALVLGIALNAFNEAMNAKDVDRCNLVDAAKGRLKATRLCISARLEQLDANIKKVRKVKDRLKHKRGADFIATMLDQTIARNVAERVAVQAEAERTKKAAELLENYDYQVAEPEPAVSFFDGFRGVHYHSGHPWETPRA